MIEVRTKTCYNNPVRKSPLRQKTPLRSKTQLKSKKPINKISKKMVKQKVLEKELTVKLMERCEGMCEICHKPPDWRGLSKHEIVFRSHGGDYTDESNCLMVCGFCHSSVCHNIKEIKQENYNDFSQQNYSDS